MNYAYYYPGRVESLCLSVPTGLTQLTENRIFMMSVTSMYPLESTRDFVARRAIGEDEYLNAQYEDWKPKTSLLGTQQQPNKRLRSFPIFE